MRIASFGSVNVDITLRVDQASLPGETRFGESVTMGLGGKGANQAVAASRLGGDVALIARIGSDAFGNDAFERLQKYGVEVSHVQRVAGASTGIALIQVDRAGQNAITVISGANATLDAADFTQTVEGAAPPGILLLQLETPLAASIAAARRVKAAGGLVIFDPAPPQTVDRLAELLALADIVLPNEHEASVLTGIVPVDEEAVRKAACRLREMGVRAPIIKCGGRGAYILLGQELVAIPPKAVEVVDTVAAGDCFAGALAVAIAEGRDFVAAARFAADAAALSVTRRGAAEAVPSRLEVDRFAVA